MSLLEPPVTDNSALNFTLSRLTFLVNQQEDKIREILIAIEKAADLADLKERLKNT